jgi:hypothetical protein
MVGAFVALIIALVIEAAISADRPTSLKLLFSLETGAIILAILYYSVWRKLYIDAATARWMRQKIAEHSNTARELTHKARETMDGFFGNLRSLPKLLRDADNFLSNADEEFHEKAYSPFWDNIEQAALRLGAFNANLVRLETKGESYRMLLHGQVHNFPPLVVQPEDIPNPARQTERLRQLVRRGQTNFEFATICEHRKTQMVILQGFRTLGEAVNNLGLTVDDSFSRVTRTINESSDREREEQVRLRETFEDAVRKWEEQTRLYEA